ncbi:MAG: methyl-accepting chemotaxis protein [Nitrospirae bacterium]|nr:methyl-accepting chemotaxis protein [Nitrospirota bacterium]
MEKRRWRRRNFFIKKELQGRYIFTYFILVLFGCLLFTVIFSLLSSDTMSITYQDSTLRLGTTPIILLTEILKAQWIFIIIGGFAVVVISMFLTHRFAGPLFRIERSVEAMISGDHSFKITLRSGDEAKELAEMLNIYNAGLSGDVREMRGKAEALRERLAEMTAAGDIKDIRQDMAEAVAMTDKLLEKLRTYTIQNDQ